MTWFELNQLFCRWAICPSYIKSSSTHPSTRAKEKSVDNHASPKIILSRKLFWLVRTNNRKGNYGKKIIKVSKKHLGCFHSWYIFFANRDIFIISLQIYNLIIIIEKRNCIKSLLCPKWTPRRLPNWIWMIGPKFCNIFRDPLEQQGILQVGYIFIYRYSNLSKPIIIVHPRLFQ